MLVPIVVALFALQDAPAEPASQALDLVCPGTGSWTQAQTHSGFIADNDGGFANGAVTSTSRTGGAQQLRVRIDASGVGRIKMPPVMLPPLHGGGKDGWWTFSDLKITDDQIAAKFSLNPLNRPRVTIDRRTGDVDLKGLGLTFSGVCERAPETPETRKF